VPPTAPNARTGELTPPGIRALARRNRAALRSTTGFGSFQEGWRGAPVYD
jgi:hypothetical protein